MAEDVNELVQWFQRAYNMLGGANDRNPGRSDVPSQALGGPFTPVSRAEKVKLAKGQRNVRGRERERQIAEQAVASYQQSEFERSEGMKKLQKLVRKEGIEFGSVPEIQKTLGGKPSTVREKGPGFLGTIQNPGGSHSTELSIGVDFGQGEMEIPLIVPGISTEEIHRVAAGGKPRQGDVDRAVAHAKKRLAAKKGVFAESGSVPEIQKTLKKRPPADDDLPDYSKGLRKRPRDVGVYW